MGRFLSTSVCSSSADRTLSSYCKIRYFMSLLRKYPRAPRPVDLRRYSLLTPGNPSRAPRRAALKKSNHKSPTPSHFLRGLPKEVWAVRFYSSSNRDAFKAEAPIGIMEKASFELSSLSGRLGQSFHRLSRHINIYFKGKDVVPLSENASLVVAAPDYVGRSQRRFQSQRAAREQNILDNKDTTLTLTCKDKEESAESPLLRHISRVQLFHISSLATRFGESYSYVANHINSVFTRGFSKVQIQQNLEAPPSARPGNKRLRRRRIQNNSPVTPEEAETSQVKAAQAATQANIVPNSWEDSYLLFARHINRYFGAKVADEVSHQNTGEKTPKQMQNHLPTQLHSGNPGGAIRRDREEPAAPESAGLFHSSRNATGFGESYFQMSTHINQYFKGQGGAERGGNGTVHAQMETGSAAVDQLRTVTFMDCLRHPTSAIPDLLGSYLNFGTNAQTSQKPKPAMAAPEALLSKRIGVSQRQTEELILGLIHSLGQASSPEALTGCVEALNENLIRHPSRKALMWQEKTAVTLLRQRRTYRHHQALQSAIRETLALIGYVDPVKGRGIRVLSIDGGGTRGVVPLQVLKLLEAETGKKVHQLFDYICGVSTGAVLAFMLGLAHFSLDECADMYRRFGSEVFRQNRLVGTVKMGWTHSYYNSETWEAILREKLGERVLIKTARDETSPKVSAVSAVVNWGNSPKAFVFCNYNHKPGSLSRYAGGSGYQMWQAVRASSAAPGYFQEFTLQSDIHQDGGIIMNNPCALAVHESRLLWPNQPFQCVLSLGTGRYDNVKRAPATSTSLRAKISSLICSATDTEGVHTLLDDLLAPDVYFRFNPMLSAEVSLDESRPGALDQLQRDTQVYLERNRLKLARACLVLGAERSAASRTKDWVSERAWEMKQRWV